MAKFNIIMQFLKDFSFESPNAPELFFKNDNQSSKMEIGIDMRVQGADNNLYMVDLIVKTHAKLDKDDKTIFLIETTYSGLVQMEEEKDEDAKKRTLLIDVPTLLFPAVRALITRMTSESGFPPFTLQPVDFEQLYEQKKSGATSAQQPANQ